MHTEEFILIPKRLFITKQPQKSEIIENPQYKNKAIQLLHMQRNKLREDVGKKADANSKYTTYEFFIVD